MPAWYPHVEGVARTILLATPSFHITTPVDFFTPLDYSIFILEKGVTTMLAEALVRIIWLRYSEDSYFRNDVNRSPEFYRALIWESGLFDNEAFDGTDEYHQLVDALEATSLEGRGI